MTDLSPHTKSAESGNEPKNGDLRVVHFPQVPCRAFHVPVTSPDDAIRLMGILARYDDFQLKQRIKPDYSSAADLEVYEDGEWLTWYDDEGDDIRAYEVRLSQQNAEAAR